MPLKVAVVGAGNVGGKLGGRLLATGNAVKYGVRDVSSDKHKALQAEQPKASLATIDDAIAWADAVILATTSEHSDEGIKKVAASLGPNIKGKVLVDATNPLTQWPALEVRWEGRSGGEILAESLPGTHVFKAFNTVGAEQLAAPGGELINGEQLTMLFAGGPEGKETAEQVVAGVGFKPYYVGPIRYARNLEGIAELWIHLGNGLQGPSGTVNWGYNFHCQVIKK